MKQGSTFFLKGVIILIALTVLSLCVFLLPAGISTDRTGDYRPILMGMYIPAIPFFYALYKGLKLLENIENNEAFSNSSVEALKHIKYCAGIISILYALGMPYIYVVADRDDAPGVVAMGLVIIFASIVIAAFASLMQKLIQNALDIKSENDLTV